MTHAILVALSVDIWLGPITLTEAVGAWTSGPGQSGSYLQSICTSAAVESNVSNVSKMSMVASTAIWPFRNSDRAEKYSRQACNRHAANHSTVSATADRMVGPRNRNGCSRGSHSCCGR